MLTTALGMLLGVMVGLRHAFEPDHLSAVSTLVSDTHSPSNGALLGALWGVGHTIAIVAVGASLIFVGATLPARAGVLFELGVAAMLLILGARAVRSALRGRAHDVRDARDGHDTHDVHAADAHVHAPDRNRWRPLVVGLVHGLAGSGALTALVFSQMSGTAARMLYMVLFGAGSIAGMAIASGVAGVTLGLFASSRQTRRGIGLATGILSMTVGVWWSIPLLT